jgi:hypothetical protein
VSLAPNDQSVAHAARHGELNRVVGPPANRLLLRDRRVTAVEAQPGSAARIRTSSRVWDRLCRIRELRQIRRAEVDVVDVHAGDRAVAVLPVYENVQDGAVPYRDLGAHVPLHRRRQRHVVFPDRQGRRGFLSAGRCCRGPAASRSAAQRCGCTADSARCRRRSERPAGRSKKSPPPPRTMNVCLPEMSQAAPTRGAIASAGYVRCVSAMS